MINFLPYLSITGTLLSSMVSLRVRMVGFAVLICSNTGWLIYTDKTKLDYLQLFGAYLLIAAFCLWSHIKFYRKNRKLL